MQLPVPGATDVLTRHEDVPAVRGISLWQEGRIDGFRYVLSADLTARITRGPRSSPWAVAVTCDAASQTCTRNRRGVAPDAAENVADRLEQCLLGRPFSQTVADADDTQGNDDPTQLASPTTTPVDVVPAPSEPVVACAAETMERGPTPVHSLQRLLNASDLDVGQIDGIVGPRTRRALAQILPEMADDAQLTQLTVTAAVTALCQSR